jgi:hypothetical protein
MRLTREDEAPTQAIWERRRDKSRQRNDKGTDGHEEPGEIPRKPLSRKACRFPTDGTDKHRQPALCRLVGPSLEGPMPTAGALEKTNQGSMSCEKCAAGVVRGLHTD